MGIFLINFADIYKVKDLVNEMFQSQEPSKGICTKGSPNDYVAL